MHTDENRSNLCESVPICGSTLMKFQQSKMHTDKALPQSVLIHRSDLCQSVFICGHFLFSHELCSDSVLRRVRFLLMQADHASEQIFFTRVIAAFSLFTL